MLLSSAYFFYSERNEIKKNMLSFHKHLSSPVPIHILSHESNAVLDISTFETFHVKQILFFVFPYLVHSFSTIMLAGCVLGTVMILSLACRRDVFCCFK